VLATAPAPEDPLATDFKLHTDDELKRLYSGMCTVAKDIGMPYERRSDFATPAALLAECEELERRLENFRAGINTSEEGAQEQGSPGLRRLRSHPQAEEIRQQTLADNLSARQEAERKIQEEKYTMSEDTAGAAAPAAPKAAKKAKKAAAPKKAAKKAAAPKKAAAAKAANSSARAGAIPGTAKITLSAAALKENPRRKGTIQHERFAVLQKFHGKTVDEFLKKGERTALNNAIARGEAKTSGG
jgi:membrane protein involved in colicin uptake